MAFLCLHEIANFIIHDQLILKISQNQFLYSDTFKEYIDVVSDLPPKFDQAKC